MLILGICAHICYIFCSLCSIIVGGDDAFDLEALVAAAMVAQGGQEEVLDEAPPAVPSRNSRNMDR